MKYTVMYCCAYEGWSDDFVFDKEKNTFGKAEFDTIEDAKKHIEMRKAEESIPDGWRIVTIHWEDEEVE